LVLQLHYKILKRNLAGNNEKLEKEEEKALMLGSAFV
jgi:hypothetical protein